MNIARRGLCAASASALTVVGFLAPVSATEPDFTIDFEDGQVCSFPLTVAGWGEGAQVYREFYDKDGNLRTLTAGTGFDLTYTNRDTGASMSTSSNGGATRTRQHADGSTTMVLTGHNVVFMFPTDDPGPSTTVYTGQAVIDVAPDGTWTLLRETGRQLDVCAELE